MEKRIVHITLCLLITTFTLQARSQNADRGRDSSTQIKWNAEAVSGILTEKYLSKMGEDALPQWMKMQMVWPSAEEIEAHSVKDGKIAKDECIRWLKKFIKEDFLPTGLEDHLIPMDNWGFVSELTGGCDVFITRFKKDPYVVHIQESTSNVIITVAETNGNSSASGNTDSESFVRKVSQDILHENLHVPSNGKLVHHSQVQHGDLNLDKISWIPPAVVEEGPNENGITTVLLKNDIGTICIEAETDCRFVRFVMHKESGGSRSPNPARNRFGRSTENTRIIVWNDDVVSRILTEESLSKMGDVLPQWMKTQMLWPSKAVINTYSVEPNDPQKDQCIDWLKKFMNKELVPADIDEHLIAMDGWGTIAEKQQELCDVFICRYKLGPYIIHIQEGSSNVLVVFSDENFHERPKDIKSHRDSMLRAAEFILDPNIVPDPKVNLFEGQPRETKDGGVKTRLVWGPPSIMSKDKYGYWGLDPSLGAKIGASQIIAESDGQYVRFNIIKCPGGSAVWYDPYVNRFGKPTEINTIKWNQDAISKILTEESLRKLSGALPPWTTKQMIWPSKEDMDSNSVPADQKTIDECVMWLTKFLKKEFLPKGVGGHLIAMNEWGLYLPREKQKKLNDVFVCRFEKSPYVVHIQESLGEVTVAIADERLAGQGKDKEELKNFILTIAKEVLNEGLLPTRETKFTANHYHESLDKKGIVYIIGWTPEDCDKKRAYIVSCRSDGRFVVFNIYKHWGGPRMPDNIKADRF